MSCNTVRYSLFHFTHLLRFGAVTLCLHHMKDTWGHERKSQLIGCGIRCHSLNRMRVIENTFFKRIDRTAESFH